MNSYPFNDIQYQQIIEKLVGIIVQQNTIMNEYEEIFLKMTSQSDTNFYFNENAENADL